MLINNNCRGQSLIEVIIAMVIFALISVSLVSMILGGLVLLSEGRILTEASSKAEEGLEAVRAIKNRAWNELEYSQSAVTKTNDAWIFVGEGTSEQIGIFSRIISLQDVYRDTNFELVSSGHPGAKLDLNSKLIAVEIFWDNSRGKTITKTWESMLTNWDSADWFQDDWEGGSGQVTWLDIDRYNTDDSNVDVSDSNTVRLLEISTSTYTVNGSLESSNFQASGARTFSVLSWLEVSHESCVDCDVRVQIKTAEDQSGSPANWSNTWSGPDGEDADETDYYENPDGNLIHKDHNRDEWIKYKLILDGETDYSPIISEVKINYQL